jgi:hypothetical protein
MKFLEFILGVILIYLGVYLVIYYQKLKKRNKSGGLSFKFQTAGIGSALIGTALIVRVSIYIFN